MVAKYKGSGTNLFKKIKYKSTALIQFSSNLFNSVNPLSNLVLIGTHHKTGTAWMQSIFHQMALIYNVPVRTDELDITPTYGQVYLNGHSRFDFEVANKIDYRGLHLIRDPRDIIVSACFYHQKSDEPWLHKKRSEFGGLTYQEKINSFLSVDDCILFEMEGSAGGNIADIKNWCYENRHFIEVKYEDLIVDKQLLLFHQIFSFLGFHPCFVPKALEIAHNNSLFSKSSVVNNAHIRSGKPRQWENHFKAIHKDRFIELFGDILYWKQNENRTF